MVTKTPKTYPGANVRPEELLKLAGAYQKAAQVLLDVRIKSDPVSLAPFRLNAIHAIELYLSATLIHSGKCPSIVRGLQHRFAERTEIALSCGLTLRQRTVAHLVALEGNREYLATRYAPEQLTTASQINRLSATLEEVSVKVRAHCATTSHHA